MLSIIVSSCDKKYLSMLKQSIEETVQTDYETIVIENNAEYSLTKAYNLGASKAKYPFLLFLHEDVVFKTDGWGKILINHFETLENVGIIGIAGGAYKPHVPSGWAYNLTRVLSFHLIQQNKSYAESNRLTSIHSESVRGVVCLDGVFLAVKKEVFGEIRFDENIKGFHGYDTDYSLAVVQRYQNYFIPDILIEHFSEGKISDQWLLNTFQIQEKWKTVLPLSADGSQKIDLEAELSAYDFYLTELFESTLPVKKKLSLLLKVTFHAFRKTRSLKIIQALLYSVRKKHSTKK
jgi:hypothetical protein